MIQKAQQPFKETEQHFFFFFLIENSTFWPVPYDTLKPPQSPTVFRDQDKCDFFNLLTNSREKLMGEDQKTFHLGRQG